MRSRSGIAGAPRTPTPRNISAATRLRRSAAPAVNRRPTTARRGCSAIRSPITIDTHAAYLQDTIQAGWLTLNLGLRWDRQFEEALESTVPAHPFAPQILPSVTFGGADPASCGTTSRRDSAPIGISRTTDGRWHMRPLRRTTANWRLAGCRRRSTPSVVWRREILPWVDVNGNRTVEGSEVDHTRLLFFSGAWDPARPTFLGSVNTVDPNIKNDRTREFIAGIDRELTRDLAVGASYIWRNYDRFLWDDRLGFGSEHYAARTFQPTAAECPVAGARCDPVSYYEPTIPIPGVQGADKPLPGSRPLLQRLQADRAQAPVQSLDGQLQRRVQQRRRPVPLGRRLRGSDVRGERAALRVPDRHLPAVAAVHRIGGQRHRQHLHEREVAGERLRSVLATVAVNVAANYQIRQGYRSRSRS